MHIGFAGLGRMGGLMAENLVRAGHLVTVWNRSAEKARAFAAKHGSQAATTPRELSEAADVVITMLADDAASNAVHRGADGLFSASGGAARIVEMGTMSPPHIADLRNSAPEGVAVIDAPVSGATRAAAEAQLMIMVGATQSDAATLVPVFAAMGRNTIFLGAPGAGTVMKLAVNMLIHGLNQTVSEALSLAEASGIDLEKAFDVIESSAAAAPMLSYRRPIYLNENSQEVTFTVDLATKDLEVTAALAEGLTISVPQTLLNLTELRAASADGYGARDMASIFNHMRKERL
ncbi:MAG: 6-phosphogluconate dehydrogenase [Ahrensia sp.]|nr:6-phosphogluconate dehydrogenase [Ahrensia sp.]|tara:strand:+ start:204737 stop:205609 length:873 start_codon:yes stop_codon:yes gene_type:complete